MLAACSPVDDLIPGPSGIGPDTDALLAARLAAGDHRALAEVFDRLGPAVHGVVLRVLGYHAGAQDVVHDVFVELCSPPRARLNPTIPRPQMTCHHPPVNST